MATSTVYPFGPGGQLPSGIAVVNDLTTGGADKALSAEMGKQLGKLIGSGDIGEEITSQYTINNGQAYGDVGSTIQTNTDSAFNRVYIAAGQNLGGRFTAKDGSQVSSYVQYVNSSNNITRRAFVQGDYVQGNTYNISFDFETGEVGVYMSGQAGTLHVYNIIEEQITLDELTVVTDAKSVLDAIEKLGTIYVKKSDHVLKISDAGEYENTNLRNRFLYGTVGGQIQYTSSASGNNIRNFVFPLDGIISVKYPVYNTASGYGSLIVDSNSLVVETLVNSTEPTGTIVNKDTSAYKTGGYKIILSIWPYSDRVNDSAFDFTYDGEQEEVHILGEYLGHLLSDDYNEANQDKALSTLGSYRMAQQIKASSGITFKFTDFGIMPSCLSTDSASFLGDGVDGSGNAIIQYSDVLTKYDALVTAYPEYVRKTSLGNDASGTIAMYSYTFEPKYWKQSIYLQAGVHGWEPDSVFALAEIMFLISNAYGEKASGPCVTDNDVLLYLRENVKITVNPCVNPWGFNDRGDCAFSNARRGQNNYNNVQLNGNWGDSNPQPECAYVNTILASLKDELSFTIDMHSTVHSDTRTRYGCFYGGYNANAKNVLTIMRTYEWLYRFYDVKYPDIVNGDGAPNPLGGGYASIGTMTNVFSSWSLSQFGVESSTMEFSDHVWSEGLHTSVAMSVAVNMYLNQIAQQVAAGFVVAGVTSLPASDIYQAKG